MLPTTRDKLTMGILDRLKQKGPPTAGGDQLANTWIKNPRGGKPPQQAAGLMGPHDDEDQTDSTGATANAGVTLPNLGPVNQLAQQDPSQRRGKRKKPEADDESEDSQDT